MASAVVEMWLAGEGAGGVCDVLCGNVNPSGRLSETLPKVMRHDFEYPETAEWFAITKSFMWGYRYYDRHPEEICYPFGHGLSYTNFEYSNITAEGGERSYSYRISLEEHGRM